VRVAADGYFDNVVALDGPGGDPLVITSSSATESSLTLANNIPSQSGDFYAEVDITVTSVTGTGDGPKMALEFGSLEVGYIQGGGVSGWYYYDGGTLTQVGATPTLPDSKTVAIGRTGSTAKIYVGGSVVFTGTYATSAKPELVATNFAATTNVDGITGEFDDFVVEDAESLGDDIYIDPTGNAC
jgi:hypothetical protein